MADLPDLTDEDLERWLASVPCTIYEPVDMQRMAREIKRHRAAKAADAKQILDVVLDATHKEFAAKYDDDSIVQADWTEIQHAIANRCAEQLATPAVRLSTDDVRIIDRALGALSSDYNDVPHDDINEIRKALAAHGAKS